MESTKTKFQRKREATYEGLVDAAMHLFHDLGYGRTRVEDIAAATGQTKGAFYFHFRNKQECFLHVVRRREELRGDWYRIPDDLDPATTSLDDALRTVMRRFAETMHGLNAWVLVMIDYFRETGGDPETRELFAAIYAGWITEIEVFVDALKARGWLATTQPSRHLATQLFAIGEGLTVHAVLYGTDAEAALYDAYLKLLSTR